MICSLGTGFLPPPSNKGKVFTNSDEELNVILEKIDDAQYNDYYDACVEKGYNIDGDERGGIYTAYDAEGYYLNLYFYGDSMTIDLKSPEEFEEIEWPNGTAGNLLPVPKSLTGKFSYEYDDSFYVTLGNTSKEDYKEYIKSCSENGFTVDYNKGDDYYYAYNADGWYLALNYKGNNIMTVKIAAPDEESATAEPETEGLEDTELETEEESTATEPETEALEDTELESTESAELNEDGLRPDFKEAMDSYEAFMDEYVDFMKKYEDNPTNAELLAEYADYMSKYADFVEDFDAWEDADLNAAETAYYIGVTTRVSVKLLEVAQ